MERSNRIKAELETQALVDELTGLYNRDGFLSIAQQLVKLASRTKRELLLVAADLKGLKSIKDSFGKDEGNVALVRTADILQETFRKSDVIACFGKDNFVVITVETRKDSGEILSSRLRENLERHNARMDKGYKLSLKIGVASIDPEKVTSADDIASKAEEALKSEKA